MNKEDIVDETFKAAHRTLERIILLGKKPKITIIYGLNDDQTPFTDMHIYEECKHTGTKMLWHVFMGDSFIGDGSYKPLFLLERQLTELVPVIEACYQRKATWDSVPQADKAMMNRLYPTSRFQ
jgi:hypothetical protein